MARIRMTALALLCLVVPVAWGADVAIDARDATLSDVTALLATQGGPRLVLADGLAERHVTFAVRTGSPWRAVRWLCRCEALVAVAAKDGRLALAPASEDRPAARDYKVASLAASQDGAASLADFVDAVFLHAYPIRAAADGAEPAQWEAKAREGKLRVTAPATVHREVLAMLLAAAKTEEPGAAAPARPDYPDHALGLFKTWAPADPAELRGRVSLELADARADRVASALSAAAGMNVFIDPWDTGLREAKLSVDAEDEPLEDVVARLAKQLEAVRVWYDGAWVLVRPSRRPLFSDLLAGAYGLPTGWQVELVYRRALHAAHSVDGWGRLPYAVERVGARLLVCGPAALHRQIQGFLSEADEGGRWPDGWPPAGRRRWPWSRRDRGRGDRKNRGKN